MTHNLLAAAFPPHTMAGRILAFLQRWPSPVHLVGGCVRDALLGRPTKDLDVAVRTDALRLARAAADALGGAYVPLDPPRNTARAVFPDPAGPVQLDVAGWCGATLEEDLRGRDFTVNALALDIHAADAAPIDVVGGIADLEARLIRLTGEAALLEDPLRGLRGVRLAAELALWGFRLEEQTAQALRRHAALLAHSSAERVRDELVRILSADQPDRWLRCLDELGQLAIVLPEVVTLRGVGQPPPHRYDLLDHTLAVVGHVAWQARWLRGEASVTTWHEAALAEALAERQAALRRHFSRGESLVRTREQMWLWAALCHDWGKPATRTAEADGLHFLGHERVGALLAEQRLRRLRFNEAEVRRVSLVVAHHMRPLHLAAEAASLTRRAVHRFFRSTGDAGVEVALLSLADLVGTYGPDLPETAWQRQLQVVARLLQAFYEEEGVVIAPPPLVRGHDLMEALGLPSGPLVGQLLEAIAEAQAAGEVATPEEALALAARLAAHSSGEPAGPLPPQRRLNKATETP